MSRPIEPSTFRKRQLMSGPVVQTATGAVLSVTAVIDFTQSYPAPVSSSEPRRPPPPHRSAVLRWNHRPAISASAYAPVDPVYLAFHVEFGEAGRALRVSSALVAFLCRCSAGSLGRRGRLRVGGCPAVTTRSVCRGSQLNFDPRVIFWQSVDRCAVRGCAGTRIGGVFCADHFDSTFATGLTRKDIRRQSRASVMLSGGVRSELNIIFGDFDGFWCQIGAWIGRGTPAFGPGQVRALVVNHAVDYAPQLALTDLSPDRIAALVAYCTSPTYQGSQTFHNICLATHYLRELRDRRQALANRVGRALSRFRLFWAPLEDSAADFVLDNGIIPQPRMPVLPIIERFAGSGRPDGILCGTVVPGANDTPTAVVFSAAAVRILARVFGRIGDFSFTVVGGSLPPIPAGAAVLDAAAPLDLDAFRHLSSADRAKADLYVLSPAAVSTTVFDAILFQLRFRHVYFYGPAVGARGIALPTFEKPELDPMVGFYFACVCDEARERGTFRTHAGGDPLWRPGGPETPGFVDTFVGPSTPVRCTQKCPACSATSVYHTDALAAEACFGQAASELLPKCAREALEPYGAEVTQEAIDLWRTIVDPVLQTNEYFRIN